MAYKRRYLVNGSNWKYQYVVDYTAERMIQEYGLNPDDILTAHELAKTPEVRIKFQADIQDYVDMGISSTLNLPEYGSKYNNESKVREFANMVASYCTRLRGLTMYPDGARGGQPLTVVSYKDAVSHKGVVFDETEEMKQCKGGICSV